MDRKIAIVGLGYVGLPEAVAFAEKQHVLGFDISERRINTLKQGIDFTNEVTPEDLVKADIEYTTNPERMKDYDFIICAVPTPINESKQPDLSPVISASETIGKHMSKGSIVVFESTVFPGATEDICVPVLEEQSGMVCGKDFFVGYSPERINPGDKENTFKTITKIVAGQNEEILNIVADVYASVVTGGIFKASSIKVAEAAKVIENTQRDVNIALMNELSMIFDILDIDTNEVIEAASSKWNFLKFRPGLVGGHCIGVDPYYLTYKAQSIGYHPEVILSGRRINDNMGEFIASSLVKQMIKQNMQIQGSTVVVLGLTFKENIPDIRNSKVIDVIRELEEFGVNVVVTDPYADKEEAKQVYDVDLKNLDELEAADAIVLAVQHEPYVSGGWDLISSLLKDKKGAVADVKGILDHVTRPDQIGLWRL
ncbi:nucleotide sugar dehydrogenase [Lentibacillus saliphilus]|uniref:nucleotide sugar dehydrogenase n=1 Tax=Lentibacillus saliphilus TaxID=2737028 RepID=UPI001C30B4B7|nr:nucleotide sugar dehydrogenase [Lentibacillus saliphilus]